VNPSQRLGIRGLVVAGLLTGCGLPIDERVQTFDEVPFDLATPTTTSTTTTTTEPATPIGEPEEPEPVEETTTTIVRTTAVELFYVLGARGDLQQITSSLPTPVSDAVLIDQLENAPSGTGAPLRSAVARNLINGFTVDRGRAVVDLDRGVLSRTNSSEQRRAIAQIALTLTLFTTPDGGIGQVSFTVEGDAISVFVPARGANSEPGEPLAHSDFTSLVSGAPPTTTAPSTSTSSTTPPTTTTPPTSSSSTTTTPQPSPSTTTTIAPAES
jgi:hypothetical protein